MAAISLSILMVLVAAPTPTGGDVTTAPDFKLDGEVVVLFEESIPDDIDLHVAKFGTKKLQNATLNMVVINTTSDDLVDDTIDHFQNTTEHEDETKNAYQAVAFAGEGGDSPTDDPLVDEQWRLEAVNLTSAWNETGFGGHCRVVNGSCEIVKVAVLGFGIDNDHEDLVNNTEAGDDRCGPDVNVTSPTEPARQSDHGTKVAGIAAADVNNGVDIAGSTDACLMDVVVCNRLDVDTEPRLTCPDYWVALGLLHASRNDATVATMSFGCGSCLESVSASRLAAQIAYEHRETLLIKSAGNQGGEECDADTVTRPGGFPEIIAVANLEPPGDQRDDSSSCGPAVELAAPGENTTSTLPDDETGGFGGTSAAAPTVAGVAAHLYWEHGLTAKALRCTLVETADDLHKGDAEPGRDNATGYGRVDALEAVQDPRDGDCAVANP